VTDLSADFRRFVAQTSDDPIGIEVERASGARIWDVDGRVYLDLIAGIGVASVGHTHPDVVLAIEKQVRRHLHVMVYGEYVQETQVALARRLASVLPPPLSSVYFTSSGAEAIEGSLKLARKWTGRTGFVAFEGGYHGDTMGALSLMAIDTYRRPFEPVVPGARYLPWNDLAALDGIDDTVAAVVIEPVQGEGGVRIPGAELLPALRRRCDETGALLVFDEVITAFGRTGRLFGGEHWNAVPDILVMAKALGGGLPLGAFAARPDVMATLRRDPPLAHVTTFGGHPVSCAAGLAALEITLRDDLTGRSLRVGEWWRRRLRETMTVPGLADIRGLGLLIGIEFDTPERTRAFVDGCRRRGLLLGWTLHRDTVVRLAPPLTIDEAELEGAAVIMGEVAGGAVDGARFGE
jgi:acetylornithine/succinyldiaminopimelate/putrescine aminotransferase